MDESTQGHEQRKDETVKQRLIKKYTGEIRGSQAVSGAPRSVVIDGIDWPISFTAENIRSAKSMKPRSDDIFICTYPKSGTTWIQHIVHQLLGKAKYDDNANKKSFVNMDQRIKNTMWALSPMIEELGAGYCDQLESPRILKSHLSYGSIPKGGGAKYIYTCRNPKDVLTSWYHHNRLFPIFAFENGKFDVFFDLFMDGQVSFGDYFDHLESWLDGIEKEEEQILFLKYEDMVADLRSAVVRIGTFLGGKAAEIIRNEQKLARIVEASTFQSMKKNQERWFPSEFGLGNKFIRKGGSRDWKNLFSYEQSNVMDRRFRDSLSDTAAFEWWQKEMTWNNENNNDLPSVSHGYISM